TVFGADIVARMNQVGMAVDVSHCGDRTTLDAIAASTRPVVFSHASARALLPGHLRCKTDEAIRAMAATGGVIGINFIRFMVRLQEPVTVEHVLDHFDYVARLVGVEHVGIGSDLDIEGNASPLRPPDDPPSFDAPNFDRYQMHMNENGRESIAGLDHTKRVFDLTEGLIRRGYSDADISLMLGGNFRRVLSEIWV
ncbi:MAG TPA: membrane dipeptidase, partial [Longimicrobiales bacterium]|nr:membrane dipeptidase [Longimicrobiales bacterium]